MTSCASRTVASGSCGVIGGGWQRSCLDMIPAPVLQTAPKFQPVSLTQGKSQLELPQSQCDHDEKVKRLLSVAIQTTEDDTGFIGADSVWTWQPVIGTVEASLSLPMPHYNPTAIASVTYTDTEGNSQTLPTADYTLNLHLVHPALVGTFPQGTDYEVTYNAGWLSNAEVAPRFVQSSLAIVQRLWDNDPDLKDLGECYRALSEREYSSYL